MQLDLEMHLETTQWDVMEVWEDGCLRWAWMIDKLMLMWGQVWIDLVGGMQRSKT